MAFHGPPFPSMKTRNRKMLCCRTLLRLTDWYESPMLHVCKVSALRTMSDSLADKWCGWLGAPETTP